jgi:hypothetical protein
MLGPTRPVPRVGGRVRVIHFGGSDEAGTIVALEDEGRTLCVRTAAGELLPFVLNPATARFALGGAAGGPRLELLDQP